mgnify:CR=1 FL=1
MSYQDLASEWHGGQFTALYSYASTGVIVDIDRLITEVYEAIGKEEDIYQLYEFVLYNNERSGFEKQ